MVRLAALGILVYGAAGYVTSRISPAPGLVPASSGPATALGVEASIFAGGAVGTPGVPASAPGEVVGAAGAPPAVWWRRLDCGGPDPRCGAVTTTAGREMVGVSSVHTGRSGDARGSLDEVAASARAAGLDFVLLGDHAGDWLHEPGAMEPRHLDDVLLVPGQELVVSAVGRTLAIGLDTVVSRWEGSLERLVRRVASRSGFVAVVHPRSPRKRERWRGIEAPGVHGWEALDVSEMARIRLADRWAAYHLTSFLGGLATGRAHQSVLRLNREGVSAPGLLAYDSARATTPVTLMAALNHHPKTRLGRLLVPGYTSFFRTHVNHVTVARDSDGDPLSEREVLLEGLRSGQVFVSLGDAGRARGFRMAGWSDGRSAPMGGVLGWRPGSELLIRLPDEVTGSLLIRVVADGGEAGWLAGRPGEVLAVSVTRPGVWRAEIFRAGRSLGPWRLDLRPWLLANPVEFRETGEEKLAER